MMNSERIDRELAIAMTSSAGLELFWSTVALGTALLGIVGTRPLALSAVSAIAASLAVLAHSGELAARWPRREDQPGAEAVRMNLLVGLAALLLGGLALAGVSPIVLAPLALVLLAVVLVLDAPFERDLAAMPNRTAGAFMALAGFAAAIVLAAGFSARSGGVWLVPWAAALIAGAYLVGAASVLLGFARSIDGHCSSRSRRADRKARSSAARCARSS